MKFLCLSLLLIALMQSSQAVPTLREERQVQNVVEIYFVVDAKAFQIYKKENPTGTMSSWKKSMKDDINFFLTEVNEMMATLTNLNIVVKMARLSILTDQILFQPDGNDMIHAKEGLEAFDTWLASSHAHKKFYYDLALLWTGYNLHKDGNDNSAGLAWEGTVCEGAKATSIVEYDGTHSTVVTTAHEIAHNLGAGHDSSKSGYIMAPMSSAESASRWSFSTCSTSSIGEVVGLLKENCLQSTNKDSVLPSGSITANLANPDAVCKRKLGSQSNMCRGSLYRTGDDLCKHFYCNIPQSTQCDAALTSDGMLCGKGKTCDKGICKVDPKANTNVEENCLFGDTPSAGSSKTCAEMVKANLGECRSSSFRSKCCASCVPLNIPGCEWGDQNPVCKNYKPRDICWSSSNAAICCETCHGYTSKRGLGEDVEGNSELEMLVRDLLQGKRSEVPMLKPAPVKEEKEETKKIHESDPTTPQD